MKNEKTYKLAYYVCSVRYVQFHLADFGKVNDFVELVNHRVGWSKYELAKADDAVVLKGGSLWGDWQILHENDFLVADASDGVIRVMSPSTFAACYRTTRPAVRKKRGS